MDKQAIETALTLLQRMLPRGATLAVVIVLPANHEGLQEGHVVDLGLDERTRTFAAECLQSGAKIGLTTQVH